jgi:hypothetical protein
LRRLRDPQVRKHVLVLLILAILTAVIFAGYGAGTFMVGTDAMGLPSELTMNKHDNSFFSTWRSFTSLGHTDYPSPVLASFYWLTIGEMGIQPLDLAKGIVVLSFFLAGVAMYLCAFLITRNHLGSFLAALAYAFNQMFLAQVTEVHYQFLLGYALFPLLFIVFYYALAYRGPRALALLPIVAILFGCVAAPNLVEIAAVFLVLFGLIYVARVVLTSRARWKSETLLGLTILAIGAALMVLPLALMKVSAGGTAFLSTSYPIEEVMPYSSASLYNALIMGSSENTFIWGTPQGQWTLIGGLFWVGWVVAILIPLMALLAIYWRKSERLVIPLVIPAILFVVLAAGPNQPLGSIFDWMFRNIPLMDSMRVYGRLLLLSGFAFALLIAIVMRHLVDDLPSLTPVPAGLTKRVRRCFGQNRRKVFAILVVLALLFPSSSIFAQEIRGFDLPAAYAEPYLWLGQQNGDYRVLTLPLGQLYYVRDPNRSDGYPSTKTLDPGIYSPILSQKAFAYGLETGDFWGFIAEAESRRTFGHTTISSLLGDAASVRYIVGQTYAQGAEVYEFGSMDNVSFSSVFEGGGVIMENGQWASPVHLLDNVYLFTGGRSTMLLAMGTGAVPNGSVGFIQCSQLSRAGLLEILPSVQGLILTDGDLTELAIQLSDWAAQEDLDVLGQADAHSVDIGSHWCVTQSNYTRGYATGATAETTAKASLSLPVSTSSGEDQELLIKLMYGPTAGLLNISFNGNLLAQVTPYSLQEHEGWISISGIPANTTGELTLENDGSGSNAVEQMILAPRSKIVSSFQMVKETLEPYKDKITMVFSGAGSGQWSEGGHTSWGEIGLGRGVNLSMDARSLVANEYLISDTAARNGWAAVIKENGEPFYLGWPLKELDAGLAYNVSFNLRTDQRGLGGDLLLEAIDPATGEVLSSFPVGAAQVGETYEHFTFAFKATGANVQFRVVTANGTGALYLSDIEVTSSQTGALVLGADLLWSGDYQIGVTQNSTGLDDGVSMDGAALPMMSSDQDVHQVFAANATAAGGHELDFSSDLVYGLYVRSANSTAGSSGVAQLEYRKISNTEYRVTVTSSNGTWLLLSESYNPLWKAYIGDTALESVPMDSVVNSFLVPAGDNLTVVIRFEGQSVYQNIIIELVLATGVATAITVAMAVLVQRKKLLGGRKGII